MTTDTDKYIWAYNRQSTANKTQLCEQWTITTVTGIYQQDFLH